MAVPDGEFEIGPTTARVRLRTGREGMAARVGHDLTITFAQWSGRISVHGDDVASAAVRAEFEMASITIVDGSGGALPLTDRDRAEITKTARKLLDVDRFPTATFASTTVVRTGSGARIDGQLTIRGATAAVQIAVAPADGGWTGGVAIRQSSFGIAPYRAFLGALRLADEVRIDVDVLGATLR